MDSGRDGEPIIPGNLTRNPEAVSRILRKIAAILEEEGKRWHNKFTRPTLHCSTASTLHNNICLRGGGRR